MQETSVEAAELARLIRAMQQHVEAGAVPEVLRRLTEELEKRTSIERRCAELFESEQLARAEARESLAANQAKDRFLAVVSHELRTPLQPVLAAASELLRDPRLPADLLDDVRTIQRNVQLEARLIDDLLDLTRITTGKLTIEPSRINMNAVIARTVEICEPDAIERKLTLSTHLRAARTWVMGDPGRLQQVLWNLVKNAVKFTPNGGSVTIESEDAGDGRSVIRVIDTGIGIDRGRLERIFDAFEQGGAKVTRRYGGLGLGLSISKMLIERHEGTLSADSAGPGQGSTFTITLPTVDAPDRPSAPRGAYDGAPRQRSIRILLVDDDADCARLLARLLGQMGHTVTIAETCAAAKEAGEKPFDVLLADIALPDGSGLDLAALFKERFAVKAIALTGYGSDDDIAASLAAGFDEHLTKPITLEQLVQAIDRLFP
jgi:signal transduction histidine kinase/CheY-like chemotaxis protein